MVDDYVLIFDGDRYNRRYLISRLTGASLPSNFSSVVSKMLIVFESQITKPEYRKNANKSRPQLRAATRLRAAFLAFSKISY